MLKQILLVFVASILVILVMPQFARFLHELVGLHGMLSQDLALIFSGEFLGKILRHSLALLIIPLLVSLIPAGIYWLIKRREMPYWAHWLWILWLLLATALAAR